MTRYCFTWSFNGHTLIEAATLAEAQDKFNEIGTQQLMDDADTTDFTQHETLEETAPGCFDEAA